MLVGSRTTLAIESLTPEGIGKASLSGLTLLVPGGATADVVDVRVVARSRHRDVAWCEVEGVRGRGPSFREASCPNASPTRGKCGGCPISHLTPSAAQAIKVAQVETALKERGLPCSVCWQAACTELAYRNRAHFVAGRRAAGHVLLGSYAPRSHDLVSMEGCEVLRHPLADYAATLEQALTRIGAPIYPERDGLRYVTLRTNERGDTLFDLVIAGDPGRWTPVFIPRLAAMASCRGISLSVNLGEGNAMRGSESVAAYGDPELSETIGPITLRLTASAFSQLNSAVCAQMYGWAAESVRAPVTIWDLYCGAGGMGLTVAVRHARPSLRLFGADSVDASIRLARDNARGAGISAEFRVMDLSAECPRDWPAPELVLINPPRRGLDAPILSMLSSLEGAELVYMSCSPVAFARDAAVLAERGWRFSTVHAFDMLPRTTHVEIIAKAEKA